jgi:proteasome lid subunit RPN8/RPN11
MPRVSIERGVRAALLSHAHRQAPAEAVGLLAGPDSAIATDFLPLRNLVSGPGFLVHPRDQFDALMAMRRQGQVLVATFHSHPEGAATLSRADIDYLGQWPCVHLVASIWRDRGRADQIAAFVIDQGLCRPVAIGVV